jgi:hypothetical protein
MLLSLIWLVVCFPFWSDPKGKGIMGYCTTIILEPPNDLNG